MPSVARLFVFMSILFALLSVRIAKAHTVGLSSGEYRVVENTVSATIVFARDEVGKSLAELDADRDGFVTPNEVARGKTLLETKVAGSVYVSSGKQMCDSKLVDAALVEGDGLMMRVDASCPRRPTLMALGFLNALPVNHKHVARVFDPEPHDELLGRDRQSVEFTRSTEAPKAPSHAFVDFVRLGFLHILSGADHLLFLLGLLLGRKSIRELVLPITAFTVAHSATLALAVLDIVHLNARFVEPAIALSIAWVGFESLRGRRPGVLVTFPFGLVHGLGFASALTDLHLGTSVVPSALVGFNLGVELGQLLVVSIAIPLLLFVQRRSGSAAKWTRFVGWGLVMIGLAWGVVRIAT